MAMSGVVITDEVKEAYKRVTKHNDALVGAIFEFSPKNDKVICSKDVEVPENCKKPFLYVLKQLPENEVRYAVIDVWYQLKGQGPKNAPIFLLWAPDGANVRRKMLGSASYDAFRKEFTNCSHFLEYVGCERNIEILASKLAGTSKNLEMLEGQKVSYNKDTGDWVTIEIDSEAEQ